jgi:hypothetical protein
MPFRNTSGNGGLTRRCSDRSKLRLEGTLAIDLSVTQIVFG